MLKSNAIDVKTIKTDLGKLSTKFQSDNLPSYTEKGPTPNTPSYKKTRNAVAIIGAKTTSNQADAAKSFDDNELTEWSNGDGKAKIELALARGKKAHDKRAALMEREAGREAEREISRRQSGKSSKRSKYDD